MTIFSSCTKDLIELKNTQQDKFYLELKHSTRDSYILTKEEVLHNLDLFFSKNQSLTRNSNYKIASVDGILSSNISTRNSGEILPDTSFYIVNFEGGGFALLPKDLRGSSVYAFSENNSFHLSDTIFCPEMKFVLELAMENLNQQITTYNERMSSFDTENLVTPTNANLSSLEPLIKVEWGQGNPDNPNVFNYLAPVVNGKYSYAGCVATAMCQIMSFWGCPKSTSVPNTMMNTSL